MTGRILAVLVPLAGLALLLVIPAVVLAQAPPPPAAPPVTVKTALAGAAQYLVDGQGKTLYVRSSGTTPDDPKTSLSTCTSAGCLAAWPLLATTGTPVAGEGVDANLLGTVKHPGGTTMATYNGWPLYYFRDDKAPGDFLGQSIAGFLVASPRGDGVTGIGPAGAAGAAGAKGAAGASGAAGPAGAAGAAGTAGAKGAKGDTGKVGAAGAAGPKGAVGAAGAAGAAGPAGGPGVVSIIGIIVAIVAVVVVGGVLMMGRRAAS